MDANFSTRLVQEGRDTFASSGKNRVPTSFLYSLNEKANGKFQALVYGWNFLSHEIAIQITVFIKGFLKNEKTEIKQIPFAFILLTRRRTIDYEATFRELLNTLIYNLFVASLQILSEPPLQGFMKQMEETSPKHFHSSRTCMTTGSFLPSGHTRAGLVSCCK